MLFCLVTGCEDEGCRDHVPPAGMGSLVIDNITGDYLELFVDGIRAKAPPCFS